MPLVDDANRDEQHAGPHVEAARQEKIEVRLLELHLAGFFQAFDKCMLQLELADEPDPRREAVIEEQHEAVKIEDTVVPFGLVEVKIHVALNGAGGGVGRRLPGRLSLSRAAKREGYGSSQC